MSNSNEQLTEDKLFKSACISSWSFVKFACTNAYLLTTRDFKIGIFICFLFGLFSSCSVKNFIGEDEYLVNKYTITIKDKPAEIATSDLRTFFKPKPNSKTLGVYWKLNVYYRFQNNQTKFNKWREKNFGEYPVFYESDHADRIGQKMKIYLDNIGFFNSKVSHEIEHKKRKVNISYTVIPAQPYYISSVEYDIADTLVGTFFKANIKKTLVKAGDIYNAYTFDDERDRITKDLRDVGYYYFNRNFVQFVVDSNFTDHELSVVLKINNVRVADENVPGKFYMKNHTRYFLKNITVIPDFKPIMDQVFDTVKHNIHFWGDTTKYNYDYLLDYKRRLKPSAFNSAIKIKPGRPYSASELQQTYRRLFNFSIIRTATINFDTTGAGENKEEGYHYMNSRISMQTAKVNSFQVDTEGTNSSGDLGIRGSVVVANKNIFKRGEVFSVRVNGGFEAQSVDTSSGSGLFNTFEAGISGNLYFPRFLFPFKLARFHERYTPVTNLNFGFSYQLRQNYSRNITNFDIGYSWDQTVQIKHILTPININYVNVIPITDEFKDWIDTLTNPRLLEQYSDHLIAGVSYSIIFNNQNLTHLNHFNFNRLNVETSGNFLYAMNSLFKSDTNALGFYEIANVRYAQYIRISNDFRHYFHFNEKKSSLVFRILLGLAVPYGNSTEIPYQKGFFAGGANDMRGWQFRTLGPGGYSANNNYERVGDIQIEGNIEYRFPIYKIFKGAFFLDVGNIWTLKETETYPNGEFKWNTWYDQLAVDIGVGVRLDFGFFVFRLDFASPVRNPTKYEEGDMWQTPYIWVLNFGIGYPF